MTTTILSVTELKAPKCSPWGAVEYCREYLHGYWLVSTPRHGGVKLSPHRNRQIPQAYRSHDGWYEEDCEILVPVMVFRHELHAADGACMPVADIEAHAAHNFPGLVATLADMAPDAIAAATKRDKFTSPAAGKYH